MTPKDKWKQLGWRHTVWNLVRFFRSLQRKKDLVPWLEELLNKKQMKAGGSADFPIDPKHITLFFDYLKEREENGAKVCGNLRTEEQAIKACTDRNLTVEYTKTKNKDHHQSAKAVVSLVNGVVGNVCRARVISFNPNPQSRCVWCTENRLHVTARNLNGAIPSLANPIIVWQIKEYWGSTAGGSKMSDAVYECNLIGRELREFEEGTRTNKSTAIKVVHIVFVDGRIQWNARRSDLKRFVDLTNQGLIDYLLVGSEIETELEPILNSVLGASNK